MTIWRISMVVLVPVLAGCSLSSMQQPVSRYPVVQGEVGPVHPDNRLQQPFACTTVEAGFGEPVIDNSDGVGQPVIGQFLFFDYIKGFSQYCGGRMQLSYFYLALDGTFQKMPGKRDTSVLPEDIKYVEAVDGVEAPFIVRLEKGVINRFIYSTSMRISEQEWRDLTVQNGTQHWNQQLIMLFTGGIGIGHKQSGRSVMKVVGPQAREDEYLFSPVLLRKGYAVTTSSGMSTDTTYHLPLLNQTAQMVKQQFSARYGTPENTFAIGGSGGAIQALYSINQSPKLIDAMVLSHVFPDLLTQINGVGDCELLEYYFDRGHARQGKADPFWQRWRNRSLVEGFNAVDNFAKVRFGVDGRPLMSTAGKGASTCTNSWRLVVPSFFNPRFFMPFTDYFNVWVDHRMRDLKHTNWSHWDDLADIYGVDSQGYGRRTYDNEGVQYGLTAFKSGELNAEQFLQLNAKIGGWLPPAKMTHEAAPYYPYGFFGFNYGGFWRFLKVNLALTRPSQLVSGTRNLIGLGRGEFPQWLVKAAAKQDYQSVWSHHNSTAHTATDIAPRAKADVRAIQNALASHLRFDGQLDRPAILLSAYLDPFLNNHDARQPHIIRQRMLRSGADTRLVSIWGLEPDAQGKLDAALLEEKIVKALALIQRWLQSGSKPEDAGDRCWDRDARLVARGDNVWAGVVEAEPVGECAKRFPVHGNPRTVAGDRFSADTLKCALKSVTTALTDGTYGERSFTELQQARLQAIFASGVCDYPEE